MISHPIQTRGQGEPGSEEFYANIEELAKTMKREGLAGMECYHLIRAGRRQRRFSIWQADSDFIRQEARIFTGRITAWPRGAPG